MPFCGGPRVPLRTENSPQKGEKLCRKAVSRSKMQQKI